MADFYLTRDDWAGDYSLWQKPPAFQDTPWGFLADGGKLAVCFIKPSAIKRLFGKQLLRPQSRKILKVTLEGKVKP